MTADRLRVVLDVDPASGHVTRDGVAIDLAPETAVNVGEGRVITLGEIVDTYLAAESFGDIRVALPVDTQLAIGETLYRALDGDALAQADARWLEIAIDDGGKKSDRWRFLQRLPWPFLADPAATFLVQDESGPWAITLDGAPSRVKTEWLLPPEPHILLIVPNANPPAGGADAQGAAHAGAILKALQPCYANDNVFANNVRVARTWPEITAQIRQFDFHIIYFYGHGVPGPAIQLDPVPGELSQVMASQIAGVIAGRPARPVVFIGNCCHGTSAARAGFGEELGDKIACVIANRTVVDLQAAREFGLQVLLHLAREGDSPSQFIPKVNHYLIETLAGISFGGRWACPVVYTNYARWTALLPDRSRALLKRATAGDVTERVDREELVKTAATALERILGSDGIKLGALAWQGEPVQGVEPFGRRLRSAVYEGYTTSSVREYLVDLLPDTVAAGTPRGHVLAAIFAALASPKDYRRRPDFIPTKEQVLELLQKHLSTAGIILLVRAGPVPIDSAKSQTLIQNYWRVWIDLRKDLAAVPQQQGTLRIVLTVAFDLPADKQVQIATILQTPADDPGSESTDLGLLSSVSETDIANHIGAFIKFYDEIAGDQIDQRAKEIHRETAGVFQPTQLILRRYARLT